MTATWSHGTVLKRNAVAVASLTRIGEVALTRDEKDVTPLDSPDEFEEVLMTIKRTNAIPIEGNLDGSAQQQGVFADYFAGTLQSWEIEFPGGLATWDFDAKVKTVAIGEAAAPDEIPFRAELRIHGKPNLTW